MLPPGDRHKSIVCLLKARQKTPQDGDPDPSEKPPLTFHAFVPVRLNSMPIVTPARRGIAILDGSGDPTTAGYARISAHLRSDLRSLARQN